MMLFQEYVWKTKKKKKLKIKHHAYVFFFSFFYLLFFSSQNSLQHQRRKINYNNTHYVYFSLEFGATADDDGIITINEEEFFLLLKQHGVCKNFPKSFSSRVIRWLVIIQYFVCTPRYRNTHWLFFGKRRGQAKRSGDSEGLQWSRFGVAESVRGHRYTLAYIEVKWWREEGARTSS